MTERSTGWSFIDPRGNADEGALSRRRGHAAAQCGQAGGPFGARALAGPQPGGALFDPLQKGSKQRGPVGELPCLRQDAGGVRRQVGEGVAGHVDVDADPHHGEVQPVAHNPRLGEHARDLAPALIADDKVRMISDEE